MKELKEEVRSGSPGSDCKADPLLVAERFLEHPRMEQRFFGFRFDDLHADGLSMSLETLKKVFTTIATIQGLETDRLSPVLSFPVHLQVHEKIRAKTGTLCWMLRSPRPVRAWTRPRLYVRN